MTEENVQSNSQNDLIFQKKITVEYWKKMNPESYYPLIIEFNDLNEKSKFNPETEEKSDPVNVIVEPIFPSCSVTPKFVQIDMKHPPEKLEFFVTPRFRDKILARVDFIQGRTVLRSLPTPIIVDDPRAAKAVAGYGLLMSVIPKLLLYVSIDLDTLILISSLPGFLSFLAPITFSNLIAYFGTLLSLLLGSISYFMKRPAAFKNALNFLDLPQLTKPMRRVK